MFDTVRSQLSPRNRFRFDRSVVAIAGLLFGVVASSTLAVLAGEPSLALTPNTIGLYVSILPLSVYAAIRLLPASSPKLPMLATLWFMACFLPLMLLIEAFFGQGVVWVGGTMIFLPKLIGFRLIAVAALSGVVFGGIGAEGTLGGVIRRAVPHVDWEQRHQEAVHRLAMVDIDVRKERARQRTALADFDRRLNTRDAFITPAHDEHETDVAIAACA